MKEKDKLIEILRTLLEKVVVCDSGEWRISDVINVKADCYLLFQPNSVIMPAFNKDTLKNFVNEKLEAIIVRKHDHDLFGLLKIGCAEAKKMLHTNEHLIPIDIIERPYGTIVVITKRSMDASDVRSGKEKME